MVKVGVFPHKNEIKDFHFSFQPNINKNQILNFSTLWFLDTQENMVLLGPKANLATSI
ncbi:ATP-binding protein [Clostridium novyi]